MRALLLLFLVAGPALADNRVSLQKVETTGSTGQVFLRDTTATGGGAYATPVATAGSGTSTEFAYWSDANTLTHTPLIKRTSATALQCTAATVDLPQTTILDVTNAGSFLTIRAAAVADGDGRVVASYHDNTAMAAGVGAGIQLAGKFKSDGTFAGFGGIKAIKANGTTNDTAANMVFSVGPGGTTAQVERMRLQSDGFLGINASTVIDRLQVHAPVNDTGISITGGAASISPTLKWYSGTSTVRARFGIAGSANNLVSGAAANDFVFRTESVAMHFNPDGGTTAAVTIASGNNVGVNETAPGTKLVVDGGFAIEAGATTINTAGATLTVGNESYIRLTLGASSSGSITLSDGLHSGQILRLQCVSDAGTASIPDATAQNVKLSAAWDPDADDTLLLHWDSTDSNWFEDARSAN